jgi:hypothetical protein
VIKYDPENDVILEQQLLNRDESEGRDVDPPTSLADPPFAPTRMQGWWNEMRNSCREGWETTDGKITYVCMKMDPQSKESRWLRKKQIRINIRPREFVATKTSTQSNAQPLTGLRGVRPQVVA